MPLEFEQRSDMIRFHPGDIRGYLGAGSCVRGPGRGGEDLSSGWDRDDVGAGLWEHGKAWGAATATSKGRRKWGRGCLQTPFLTRGLTDPSTGSLQPPTSALHAFILSEHAPTRTSN